MYDSSGRPWLDHEASDPGPKALPREPASMELLYGPFQCSVSVLVPCYRQAKFLREVIASLHAQTFTDWEAIIVAGSSEDLVAGLSLASDRIRVIQHPSTGASDARNVAARAARGRWLLPLDADDKLAPTFLRKVTEAIGPWKFAVAHTDLSLFGDKCGDWCPAWSRDGMLRDNCLQNTSLHTRALWEAVGGWDVAMLGFEDWAYWVSCSRYALNVARVPEKLFHQRQWAGNMTHVGGQFASAWKAMIRMRHPDLYCPDKKDRQAVAAAKGLLPRLREQLTHFPTNESLQTWAGLMDGTVAVTEPEPK